MRLALMELDRENGVDVGDGLSSADRLAGTSMPKRRRRDAESDARAGQGQGEVVAAEGPWQCRNARGRGGRRWPSSQARGLEAMSARLQLQARTPPASARLSSKTAAVA